MDIYLVVDGGNVNLIGLAWVKFRCLKMVVVELGFFTWWSELLIHNNLDMNLRISDII